ncbi:hypothetical protein ABZX92_00145 [Lentzea sp. NPDC006480]|uniref:hypothetical protein n=1 Tax=Lentzea sp. NPDC006480 TaxID=3157176 RepID=UPI0033B99E5F
MTETELRPGLDRHQRQLLKKLVANEQSPALAEMAKELLAGRTTPAQILTSRAYDEALGAGAEALSSWYATTSDEDRQALAEQGQAELARLAEDELAGVPDGPEPVQKPAPKPEPEEDLSEQTWSRDSW